MATPNKRTALVCAGLAVCNVLIAATAQAQDVSFVARRDFDAGTRPNSVAPGDFNGDGVQDLAMAAYFDVSVLLGDGNGRFQGARTFGSGSPLSVAVGDFNGDGVQDLAVANDSPQRASVLLGNGDGTFQVARNFAAGTYPRSIAVGDFNGD